MNETLDPDGEGAAYYQAEALLIALINDDPETLESVIKAGGDVNTAFDEGQTPLHILMDAAIDGMMQDNLVGPDPVTLEMIGILLRNGADLSGRNDAGETPLDLLNIYADSEEGFEHLKDVFRPLIADIDGRVPYNPGT